VAQLSEVRLSTGGSTMVRRAKSLFGLVALALAGCVSVGPQADLSKPLAPGDGRIVVYRNDGIYESLDWVPVTFNGREVGGSGPQSVFLRDVAPGSYRIDVLGEALWPDQQITVRVAAGETAYVKIGVFRGPSNQRSVSDADGPIFVPEAMDAAAARQDISELSRSAALQ
jgi:hypothetical protein